MMSLISGNAGLALLAALLWGGGDFSGGMGVKSAGGSVRAAVRVVLLSHLSSFVVLAAIASLRGDPLPHGVPLLASLIAGLAGGASLVCFYIALSRGAMGASAAVSGLLAAAIPALVSALSEGSPGALHLLGFAVAGGAIWMIAAGPTAAADDVKGDRSTMILAVAAGVGFGIYFVALKVAGAAGVLWPMALARTVSISLCGAMVLLLGRGDTPVLMNRRAVLWALSTALLDTSGNLLFLAATRLGRLDVAAVLASLYPASTILLAAMLLRERPTGRQGLGMAAAAVAVIMITL